MSLLIVSGTGTGVGKTVTTAAVAALACARGQRVAVVKPAQTGELAGEQPGAPGDLAVVAALTGLDDLHELARYPDPLSPEAAARTAGLPPLDLRRAADHIAGLAQDRDLVIVEGAGGLLVRYDPAGSTIADLAAMLDAPVLVVAASGLGTLNHTALTLEALAARKLACAAWWWAAGGPIPAWPTGATWTTCPRWPVARWPGCSRKVSASWARTGSWPWPGGRWRRCGAERTTADYQQSRSCPAWINGATLAYQCAMRHTGKAAGQPLGGSAVPRSA